MQDYVMVTGMVLKAEPIGEYDKRIVILTKEKGKISVFAKGARRQHSRFMAMTNPFSFGDFKLFVGKNSYNLMECNILNYFESLRIDFEAAYYGMFFLELCDYYARENNDEIDLLKLLYQSLKALTHERFSNEFVRVVFEIKVLVVEGEFPGLPKGISLLDSTVYAIDYIANASIERLYTFDVTEEVLSELIMVASRYRARFYDKNFKSLEILKNL